ncbi:MAG: hypothetical protein HY355_05355, partial [Armatimonadetes bacterium]|nr:hypothetical protein [Armatimonadota bacterium]
MGRIVREGREYLCIAPWAIALDWAVISLTILVLNLLGAALREGSRALRRDLAARQPAFTLRQFHDRLL